MERLPRVSYFALVFKNISVCYSVLPVGNDHNWFLELGYGVDVRVVG